MYHKTKIFFGLFLAWIIADLPLHAAQKNVVPPPQRILIKDRKDLRKQNRLSAAPKKIAVQKTPVKKAVPAKKPAAQTKSTTLKTYTINKNSYVDLNDAAKYYKAKLTVSGKSLRLSSKSSNIAFEVGKRSGSINGTAVTFSFAPVKSGNRHYISLIDFTKTLIPALSAKLPQRKLMKIMIDPGHGGTDKGAVRNGICEKDLNLKMALKLRDRLKKYKFQVVMTRATDKTVSLEDRAKLCEKEKVDLYISIHCNAAESAAVRGIETWYLVPKNGVSTTEKKAKKDFDKGNNYDRYSMRLAFEVQKGMKKQFPATPDRGVKPGRFYVLRHASAPAILMEVGFLSNAAERLVITKDANQNKIVDAVIQGLTGYVKAIR